MSWYDNKNNLILELIKALFSFEPINVTFYYPVLFLTTCFFAKINVKCNDLTIAEL